MRKAIRLIVILALTITIVEIAMLKKQGDEQPSPNKIAPTSAVKYTSTHSLAMLKKHGIDLLIPGQEPIINKDKAEAIARNYFKGQSNPVVAEYWDIVKDNKTVPAWIVSFRGLSLIHSYPSFSVCQECHPSVQSFSIPVTTEVNIVINASNGEFIDDIRYR